MTGQVFIKNYSEVEVNAKEIFRYAGVKTPSLQDEKLLKQCLKELDGAFRFSVCYGIFPVSVSDNEVDFGFSKTTSKFLANNLKDCDKAVVFCATIGLAIDRLIAKYGVVSPSKALVFQAIGAERIESLCNLFSSEILSEYKKVKPRFSPGYGDLDLEFQRDIFIALDYSKKIGVNLTSECLMSPSKSVTAIIGIPNKESDIEKLECENCSQKDCEFRREL